MDAALASTLNFVPALKQSTLPSSLVLKMDAKPASNRDALPASKLDVVPALRMDAPPAPKKYAQSTSKLDNVPPSRMDVSPAPKTYAPSASKRDAVLSTKLDVVPASKMYAPSVSIFDIDVPAFKMDALPASKLDDLPPSKMDVVPFKSNPGSFVPVVSSESESESEYESSESESTSSTPEVPSTSESRISCPLPDIKLSQASKMNVAPASKKDDTPDLKTDVSVKYLPSDDDEISILAPSPPESDISCPLPDIKLL